MGYQIAVTTSRVVERHAAALDATITVSLPSGRSATGTFAAARTFDASTDGIGFSDCRLHAYVLHLLKQAAA